MNQRIRPRLQGAPSVEPYRVGVDCDRVRMPFSFDPAALYSDACRLPESAWERHFNSAYYEGDWSGAALRSASGRLSLYAQPEDAVTFADTALLRACPNIRAALATFQCALNSVRLLRLGPGARVREHRDYGLEFDGGEARFHVPIVNDGSEFVLQGWPVPMQPGECWYVDVNRPHSVRNAGARVRIHLVIDCVVNEWVKGVVADGSRADGTLRSSDRRR
jgi:mannose-6-phosphate isomerase-like protein (cupin superfamily)